jgi:hypothetical protein
MPKPLVMVSVQAYTIYAATQNLHCVHLCFAHSASKLYSSEAGTSLIRVGVEMQHHESPPLEEWASKRSGAEPSLVQWKMLTDISMC